MAMLTGIMCFRWSPGCYILSWAVDRWPWLSLNHVGSDIMRWVLVAASQSQVLVVYVPYQSFKECLCRALPQANVSIMHWLFTENGLLCSCPKESEVFSLSVLLEITLLALQTNDSRLRNTTWLMLFPPPFNLSLKYLFPLQIPKYFNWKFHSPQQPCR